jgi:hypothetical protein
MLNPVTPLVWIAAAAVALGVGATSRAQDRGEVVSRFSSIWPHDCAETGNGAADDQDWVSYRCEGEGGIAVSLLFTDSVRLSLGFGDRTAPFMGYRADREQNWPVEWRGRMFSGRFVPHAAIVRMKTHPEDEMVTWSSELVVFGISERPCVIGEVHGARANEQARRLADTGRC